ncbi:hypothetical protein A3C98_05265 [Candidatus Roizmanbacteria bacterium RIFCSPHIGHO2_02_FULL_37_15]|uniref:Uncharacterized protein n=1 Tax=Candidatus Roizmanbacteria bacterium RIFCSPLOWO2_01_FULL_37_16 TaxID=1802058 RepID=A0A1F7ILL0_9BACT|nr:MAG: hypothetical protein A2859_03920 [Candidatus Roizmanbacteria bacterium RIFCSPHIGHO2_01_FULL_37_16b]OGK22342.1 MAG: hypothetical protein A3C98_05265 [Candidatus Roizmanbacteria bacterium RIFCSPHIGHO2_02_FULL_37_15]OGK33666.1 MAG: hypothetical protein A3F57_04435 [Candidatus Roizmanbacteria bacterium RIFCSPHIGHO2_12_FULL_36_11]OGK44160.1 MAG: hypothetical protein A3B40_04770 [Candidatus Roizmanbacteria bacterium RIFCSPLOWO2_01_FULL_37_16]OGK56989.1 MAG: hypothetical protein A3I50_04690 [C
MWKTIIFLGIIATAVFTANFLRSLFNKAENFKKVTQEAQSYISCGCGCCGFDKPLAEIAKVECLYKLKGESIEEKIEQDKKLTPEQCAAVGCSFPIKYVYCD